MVEGSPMLDGLTKHVQDRFWNRVGRHVARLGVSANQITWAGVALSISASCAYAWHRNALAFVVTIVAFELLDDLDGAIARVTNTSSRDGAFLDAMTDRYKDAALLAALAYVHHAWVPAFAAVCGATFTSYAKARAGMEMPVDNAKWPDVFERFERIAFVCVMLVVTAFVPDTLRDRVVFGGLVVLAALTHLSAVQRIVRARRLLRACDVHEERSHTKADVAPVEGERAIASASRKRSPLSGIGE